MQVISIWLVPSEEDEKYLKDIIDELGQKYQAPSFTPHLTTYGDINIEPEIAHQAAKESIKGIQPFTIIVDKLNYTDFFFKTVFIKFRDHETLNAIYQRLKDKLGQHGEYILKPHISLIYKKLNEEKGKEIIQSLNVKNDFTINKIVAVTPGNVEKGWYDVENWQVLFAEKFGSS